MSDLPTVMTKNGLQPQTAQSLRDQLVAIVQAIDPSYTANLPGSLIEDIASTDTAAMTLIDHARVELVNSLTPYGANEFLLNQLGQIYGVQLGQPTNTSVFVQFSSTPGFVIAKGFIVSDGSHQYFVQDGGIIGSGGNVVLFCVATISGTWAVPANTVTSLVTSVPSSITLTCTNPNPGNPSTGSEDMDNYRKRVLQAGLAASTGMTRYLKTLLNNISGVQTRLISVRQISTSWEILCGGGDPYTVGFAIYEALSDINNLVGSSTTSRNIVVSIYDAPDSYNIIYVNPVLQTVAIDITWNTTLTNYVSNDSVSILVANAITDYINNLYVGDAINLFELQTTFQVAVAAFIPAQNISKMVFNVYIDSVLTPPVSGTGLIEADPEGYFFTQSSSISVTRG